MNDPLEQLSRAGPGAVKMGTSGRPLLTVFLLVRDEEETLDRAIDSVTALGPVNGDCFWLSSGGSHSLRIRYGGGWADLATTLC